MTNVLFEYNQKLLRRAAQGNARLKERCSVLSNCWS